MKFTAIFASVLVLMLTASIPAQELPKKIRGYKLDDARITVANFTDQAVKNDEADAFVRIGQPKIAEMSILGATVEIGAEITAAKQSGQVDLMTFRDFCVNGIAVDVEEYKQAFGFKKGEMVTLPKPARIFFRVTRIPKAAYTALFTAGSELTVTGTILVFGKFKKMGLSFKRVVPVKIELKVANPLRPKSH